MNKEGFDSMSINKCPVCGKELISHWGDVTELVQKDWTKTSVKTTTKDYYYCTCCGFNSEDSADTTETRFLERVYKKLINKREVLSNN